MWSVISHVRGWIDRRRAIRRRWQRDARSLIAQDERGAYCAAQRLAARSRALGEQREFMHWAKVAAEVARLSPCAEMDIATVRSIADDEMAQRHRTHNG
ncbi:hypothetical protein [Inquilinus sp. CAU 1745]|uniref:hypothetical protein n=1 Tax=Inquilinus sp. CAU 1745 TaxID=3140369 RepID=UPI00325AB243